MVAYPRPFAHAAGYVQGEYDGIEIVIRDPIFLLSVGLGVESCVKAGLSAHDSVGRGVAGRANHISVVIATSHAIS